MWVWVACLGACIRVRVLLGLLGLQQVAPEARDFRQQVTAGCTQRFQRRALGGGGGTDAVMEAHQQLDSLRTARPLRYATAGCRLLSC